MDSKQGILLYKIATEVGLIFVPSSNLFVKENVGSQSIFYVGLSPFQ